ncbi:MAG: cell division FtsA domain-containing protein [Candidatus Saccharibacteria bacterium]|nr:cell division FtsA domain-containing protein [Candidatus Saccharibacteria bacterium]
MKLFSKNEVEVENTTEGELKVDDNAILALDIGTEYVKAVIAKQKKNTLEVIGAGRAHQGNANMYSGAIADIQGVTAVCEKALYEAEKEARVRSKVVVVGIAGELIKGNTTTVRYRRKDGNKPLTEQEMDLIIKRVQEKAGERARTEVALETNNPDVEVRLINSAIVSLLIDGYKISNPIGFQGSDLTIQFYTAYAPLVHISAIEKVCAEMSLDLLAVAVEPFAVCRACLGDEIDSSLSAIVMDIGGGTTDIAIVDDGGVEGTKMFGVGGRSMTHQIAEGMGVDFNTAEKIKVNMDFLEDSEIETDKTVGEYTSEGAKAVRELSRNDVAKLKKSVEKNLEVWMSGVELALEDFDVAELLPNQILLCGGGAGLSELQEKLATGDWYKELPFSRRPVVHLLESADMPGVKNLTEKKLDHSYATAFGLLRVGIDTLNGAPEKGTIRDKLSKLLQN